VAAVTRPGEGARRRARSFTRALTLLAALDVTSARAQRAVPLNQYCVRSIDVRSPRLRPHDDSLAWTRRPGRIYGQIVNDVGIPLSNSSVVLLRRLADTVPVRGSLSDASGVFRIESVTPGEYVLAVRSLGFQRQWQEVRVLGAGSDTLCIRLRSMPIEPAPLGPPPVRRSVAPR
jgi:hypothetical protein